MKIPALIAAATICLSANAAASAVTKIDLSLRLDSMTTTDVTITSDEAEFELNFPSLDLSTNRYGINHPFNGLNIGDTLRFQTTIVSSPSSRYGQAENCTIGPFDCATTEFFGAADATGSSFSVQDGNTAAFGIFGETTPNSRVSFSWCNDFVCTSSNPDGFDAIFNDIFYELTVLPNVPEDLPSPAVVPVPASLPLLAFGLLGLGLLRRRKT